MKNRQGFVSNSSSSSFIILVKNEGMCNEELMTISKKNMQDFTDIECINEYAIKYSKEQKYILLMTSLENGAEEGIEDMMIQLLENCGINTEYISFEHDE